MNRPVSTNLEYEEIDFGGVIGTKWENERRPSSSSTSNSDSISDNERRRVITGVMKTKFKLLMKRFFEVEGIPLISTELGGTWLDVITKISWEAAELIKSEPSEGKEMDPLSYIKVKCVASGTITQSVVIKGLVFKKNTTHKHMPSSFKNPRLLLLKGVLGHNDSSLSFLNALDEESRHMRKLIIEMLETCQPDVILVEKTVSRDIQELLLTEGISLVVDMKQNHLEKISQCTGSTITSFSDALKDPKLKSCKSFHIKRFVEEHMNVEGKIPTKTLMFLEGFQRPSGCTILLRGANIEELKKVKHMLQYTVFTAYHLMKITSFFGDQRVFLNGEVASNVEPPLLSDGHIENNPNPSQNAKKVPLLSDLMACLCIRDALKICFPFLQI